MRRLVACVWRSRPTLSAIVTASLSAGTRKTQRKSASVVELDGRPCRVCLPATMRVITEMSEAIASTKAIQNRMTRGSGAPANGFQDTPSISDPLLGVVDDGRRQRLERNLRLGRHHAATFAGAGHRDDPLRHARASEDVFLAVVGSESSGHLR